jgi:Predicted restriction endonuclease
MDLFAACLDGPHEIKNGLLLRKDFHTLFDRGYITVDKNLTVEVSRRIKEDFGNGKEYYAHHGNKLIILPERKGRSLIPIIWSGTMRMFIFANLFNPKTFESLLKGMAG